MRQVRADVVLTIIGPVTKAAVLLQHWQEADPVS